MAHVDKSGRRRHTKASAERIKRSSSRVATTKEKAEAWRVIAPFVTIPKKVTREREDEQFSFYLKKKPEVLIRDLSSFMSDSVDLPSLFHETAEVLKKVTKASWVTLYLVDRITNEIYQSKQMVIKERHKVRWLINEKSIVAAFVAAKKEYVLVEDILRDPRFPEGIGYNGSDHPKSVLCIPIVTPDADCFGVVELVRNISKESFEEDDLKICVMVTAWMGVAIHQNQERLALRRQQELNDYLLDLIKCYFEDHVIMEKLMREVVKFAKVTLGAERGSFFILDSESDEMVAHLFDESSDDDDTKARKVRFSKDRGIAGLVAKTGKTVNIRDAYQDSRFYKEIDQKTGFITRSILCMPILGANGVLGFVVSSFSFVVFNLSQFHDNPKISGVVQVVNKKNGGCFTSADETLFKTFSLYCSLAVHYTNIHSNIVKEKYLNSINLRTVKLQQVPCIHDKTFFAERPTVTIPEDFNYFSWYVNNTEELELAPQYILHILFDLIDVEEIDVEVMKEFILTVRKFYRDIPYHNFEHAFNVCHCMYVILRKNKTRFSKLEIKALIIACICHDLDHVGLTNNFLQLIHHDLAVLYESSILENHHTQMAFRLLDQMEIFRDFSDHTRKLFYDEIQAAIIATDLALYFECRNNLIKIYNSKKFSWSNASHRSTVKAIMMNSCDLSGMCKPFLAAKRICDNLYREFYRQGDMEKELGVCPLSVMDRDKQDMIPEDQIRFLNVIVLPCLDILRAFLPNTKDLYLGAVALRSTWQDIINMRGQKVWRQDDSIAFKIK